MVSATVGILTFKICGKFALGQCALALWMQLVVFLAAKVHIFRKVHACLGTYTFVLLHSSPAGTYSDEFNAKTCKPCASGTYGATLGASDNVFCLPCPSGTYSAQPGLVTCTKCGAGAFCPLATSTPVVLALNKTNSQGSQQPDAWENTDYDERIALISAASGTSGVVILLSVFIGIIIQANCVKKESFARLDRLFQARHNYKTGPMLKKFVPSFLILIFSRATCCGAFFSLIAILTVVTFVTMAFVTYFKFNAIESRSVLPNLRFVSFYI